MITQVTLIIGLPGSGKSTLGNALSSSALPKNTCVFIDDISIVTNNAKDYLLSISEENNQLSHIIISDVFFCKKGTLDFAVSTLKNIFQYAKIEFIYFSNEPEFCLNNVKRRTLEGDKRKVNDLIRILSKEYFIPQGISPKKVYSPTK